MLVFSEGVPRSGKSYDAVKNHILPALKNGRHVYARLNGLNHEAIAAYLTLPVERVQELLHVVDTRDVLETFVAVEDQETGKWSIHPKFVNALVVIDEVHEFYVGGTREALNPAVEQFFALHGHYGMDVLTMTQFYKRVHTAIRFRIERKNTFQKLSALGKKGENLYRETAWQTVAPDKYEKSGARTCSYDKAIFPLYHGIAGGSDGGVQQQVYGGGRVTIWKTIGLPALIMIPIGLAAIWFLLDFFSGGGTALVKSTSVGSTPAKVQPVASGEVWQQPVGTVAAAPKVEPTPKEKALKAMTPEQRYVWDLTGKARIRFTGSARVGDRVLGFVEWFDSASNVLERLSLEQLRALGVQTEVAGYGVKLLAHDEAIIATAWPVNMPVREREARLYNTAGAAGRDVSEANLTTAAPGYASGVAAASGAYGPSGIGTDDFRGQQARYGQMRTAPIPADYEGSMIR